MTMQNRSARHTRPGCSAKTTQHGAGQQNGADRSHVPSATYAMRRMLGNQVVSQVMQTKLEIGQSDDKFEREADRLASRVISMSDNRVINRSRLNPAQNSETVSPIQHNDEHSNRLMLASAQAMTHGKAASGDAPQAQQPVLKTQGVPLPHKERAFFEPRFGRDLGQVRIHTYPEAQHQARALHARAFTLGQDVAFGAGEYQPHNRAGRQLLAHELVHTLQQSGRRSETGPAYTPSGPRIQRLSLESIVRFFGGGTFDDAELQAYLQFLDTQNRIEDAYDSDNKARAVVARWQAGDSLYILPVNRKILLIREMMSGFTGDADENAILSLLHGATPAEFQQIITTIGQSTLRDEIHGAQRQEYDALVAQRATTRAADQALATGAQAEVFSAENILELQRSFTRNARLARNVRENCILIIRSLAPQLFSADPQVAQQVQAALGRLQGRNIRMTEFGRVLSDLGLVSNSAQVRFNNGNGNNEPTAMQDDPWNLIMGMVGNVPGWHVFGLAPFNGYHSVTVLVNNRADGPRLYWADQWRIDPGEDFDQEPGFAPGFRRYEQAGFNRFILEYTRSRWNSVHSENSDCGQRATRRGRDWDRVCRWATTLHIWKFRSRLAGNP